MNLVELNGRFSTEDKCREFLKRLRWPKGVECPRCKSKKISRLFTQKKFECSECAYQFSVTVGTIFHDSHLPLDKWFLATYLICDSRKGISANQVKRMLGISYKTAWFLCHRIRQAMMAANGNDGKLTGVVEIDDTWIGGKKEGMGAGYKKNKAVVVGMIERGGRLRLVAVPSLSAKSIGKAVRKHISKDIDLIISDEWAAYVPALGPQYKRKYRRIKHAKTYVEGDIHTNSIENAFSLLKRGIIGTWHNISVKHLQRYLDEMSFRFSQRKSDTLFVDTLRQLVSTPNITFEKLTA